MADTTKISWCDSTHNPWLGCSKVSPGCVSCYAEKSPAVLFRGIKWGPGQPRVRTSAANWKKPLAWNRAAEKSGVRRKVFCGSLCDVFDAEVSDVWRAELFDLIRRTPGLDWLLLTKRAENINNARTCSIDACVRAADASMATADWLQAWVDHSPPPNVWLGVTVENQEQAERRIPLLLAQRAAVRFLSCEPMLGPIDLSAFIGGPYVSLPGDRIEPNYNAGIGWCIVGGESGPKARPFDLAWARSIRDQCKAAGVAYFCKQLGANPITEPGPLTWPTTDSHGADPAEWPEDLRIREFPTPRAESPTPRSTT